MSVRSNSGYGFGRGRGRLQGMPLVMAKLTLSTCMCKTGWCRLLIGTELGLIIWWGLDWGWVRLIERGRIGTKLKGIIGMV